MFIGFRIWAAVAAALTLSALAGGAYAAACCNVPSTHQVRVPGVVIGRPTVQQGCGSTCGGCDSCSPPPTPCDTCSPPPPSCNDNCGGHGGKRRRGDFSGDFSFTANLAVSASAAASSVTNTFANSSAFGLGGAINGSQFYGNGGSSFYVDYNTGYIPNLLVEEGAAMAAVNVPFQASRSGFKIVVIQAVCIDDKAIPHPASQVTPDKEIADSYEGELYRCLAGTRMQYTWAEYSGKVDFAQGQTTTCDKNSALYHVAGGRIECRAQKAARDCNERSLLRRYGAGIKIVKIFWSETYTAYRTETQSVQTSAQASAMGMAIDGGVGGVAH
jgi:hypothetical protein